MAADEPNTIDIIAQELDGAASPVISDHLDWDDSLHHQKILQDKLNSYLRFLESGELYTRFPSARGQWPLIEIFFLHEPDCESIIFLSTWASTLEDAGLKLIHRMHKGKGIN